MFKKILVLTSSFILSSFVYAGSFTFNSADGGSVTFNVPDSIDSMVNDYKDQIQQAIYDNHITQAQLNDAKSQVENQISSASGNSEFAETYNVLKDGLKGLNKDLLETFSAQQVSQNQWAQAWIGYLVPDVKLGGGVDLNVTSVSLKSIKTTMNRLGASDVSGVLKDSLPLPTANFDLRIGGIVLPFDIGFELGFLDTSKIGFLNDALDGFGLNYFSIGGDLRYAILYDMPCDFKLSVNGGVYYTKTGVFFNSDSGGIKSADMNFKALTFSTGAQVSAKFAFLVPYGGVRMFLSHGELDWSLSPNWKSLLNTGSSDISSAVSYFLPKTIKGKIDDQWIFRPQMYLGLGMDLGIFDITSNLGYTFISNVWNFGMSFRFANN